MDSDGQRQGDRKNKGKPAKRYSDADYQKKTGADAVDHEPEDVEENADANDKAVTSFGPPFRGTMSDDEVSVHSGRSHGSNRSSRSVRRKILEVEFEAVKRQMEFEKRQMELEKNLIQKKLELDLARIEEEDGGSQWSSVGDLSKVDSDGEDYDKFEKKVDEQAFHSTKGVPFNKNPDQCPASKNPLEEQLVKALVSIADNNKTMVDCNKTMAEFVQQQTSKGSGGTTVAAATREDKIAHRKTLGRELPSFSGNPDEWPVFFASYNRTTQLCGYVDDENIARLQKALKGRAREVVGDLLADPGNINKVLDKLEKRFGRPEFVIESALEKAKAVAAPKEGKIETLISFSDVVDNLVTRVTTLKRDEYLMNPQLIKELTEKLPMFLKTEWASHREDCTGAVTLQTFADWLNKKTRGLACYVTPSSIHSDTDKGKDKEDRKKNDSSKKCKVLTVTDGEEKEERSSSSDCLFCKKKGHEMKNCRSFGRESVDDKWKFVTQNKICFCCLLFGHRIKECKSRTKCGKDDCQSFHHVILHKINQPKKTGGTEPEPKVTEKKSEVVPSVSHTNIVKSCSTRVMLKILPVKLRGPAGELDTFAMLDGGSQKTFILTSIARKLGLKGPNIVNSYRSFGTPPKSEDSRLVSLKISGLKNKKSFDMKRVYTKDDLDLPTQSVDFDTMPQEWNHLKSVNLESMKDAKPTLLIGNDNAELISGMKSIFGPRRSPILTKTQLGWVVHGNASQWEDDDVEEFISSCFNDDLHSLHELVKKSFATEDFGVKESSGNLLSAEDKRAIEIVDSTSRRIDDRWETGLLWRHDNVEFPESKSIALNRLYGIERRMDRDSSFAEKYQAQIQDYVDKGYVRRLLPSQVTEGQRVKYLPHFVVLNPNKPDKFRVVFDAAAKSGGISLNDSLLTGPDLQNSIVGLLFKFRQREIALIADIKEFFHQVKIRPEDRPAQRFLWRGMERNKNPDVYEFQVMIFGATCSPFSAQEIRNKNAREFKDEFPDAEKAIIQNHYMDDYIDSRHNTEDALTMVHDVTEVHRRGGFHLCNWMSNSQELLDCIPEELKKQGKKEIICDYERVLGLYWNANSDFFSFTLKFHKVDNDILTGARRPTKREVLRLVMSLYDPLGLIAHFVIRAKILLQDIWRSKIGWDDYLTDPLNSRWEFWVKQIPELTEVKIPRCYSLEMRHALQKQLHIFCDASKQAFCAVAFLRTETPGGFDVSFVIAKTRVAPLRPMSIPRLELQAAVMASRLSGTIQREHDLSIQNIYYWTDAKTVMSWVTSQAHRFKTFVAHRVGEIQELTNSEQWHWIPTKLNVADDATRDSKVCDLSPTSRWFTGPEFLRLPETKWPSVKPAEELDEEEMEFLPNIVALVTCDLPLPKVDRFEDWLKLIRSTAWILRFLNNWISKNQAKKGVITHPLRSRPELTTVERQDSEKLWARQSQKESFPDDFIILMDKRQLTKRSKLYSLDPFIDGDGLIRFGGRLDNAIGMSESARNPIILDPKNPYTRLLIGHYHVMANHHGQEKVLNDLRQKYWVLRARTAVRSAWNSCQKCRIRTATPQVPMMGQLPLARVTTPCRPFEFCGIDYFGPMEVTIGRRREKRYGVLFSCLSTRAVHLEIAPSLTTDSAINAIRRMINRRGSPKELHSDNGTNLRGADKELQRALDDLDQGQIMQEMTKKSVDWHFIPPSAPHMGGSWERMVKSVKTSLRSVLKEQAPKEDDLHTLFTEAENLVNSRPLTKFSDDPNDEECLTPNHFLIGSSGASQTPGSFEDRDLNLRNRWRYAQKLVDHFWKRWIREYLPSLAKRTKWHGQAQPIKIGDIVLIVDTNIPRNVWPKGRVIELHPGRDGHIRVVTIKTKDNILKRPVAKLCVIDSSVLEDVVTPDPNIGGKNVAAEPRSSVETQG